MNRGETKQQVKSTKLSYLCGVCVKERTMEQESIQCDGCHSWLHQNCMNMSMLQHVDYSENMYLQLFFRRCTSDSNGNYNFSASWACTASRAPDVNSMRHQAESENELWISFITSHCLPLQCLPVMISVLINCLWMCCSGYYSTLYLLLLEWMAIVCFMQYRWRCIRPRTTASSPASAHSRQSTALSVAIPRQQHGLLHSGQPSGSICLQ